MNNYKFISNEDELKWFWQYGVPPLARNEIYFVSLSCRNKMLSEEEREYYKAGRSEMFAKQQIRHDDYETFIQHIKRFEVREDAFTTKSGVPYPQKSLVVYWNICPIDCYKAMKDQVAHLTEIMGALTDSALKNSQGGIEEAFYKVRKSFDTAQSLFARNFGTKHWVDIDVDMENNNQFAYEQIRLVMNQWFKPGDVMYIYTAGGFHCLIRRSALKMNPEYICNEINKVVDAKEVVRNSNEMAPLPGCYQYQNYSVHVMNKEDFTEEHKLHVL